MFIGGRVVLGWGAGMQEAIAPYVLQELAHPVCSVSLRLDWAERVANAICDWILSIVLILYRHHLCRLVRICCPELGLGMGLAST